MFNIDNHENEIVAVGYENKTIETKEKWNQLNIIDIQSLLGTMFIIDNHKKEILAVGKKNKKIETK